MWGIRAKTWSEPIASCNALARHALVCLALAGLCAPAAGRAEQLYSIDQRVGDIAFSVGHLGLFRSEGEFRRFDGRLTIDLARPDRTKIAVEVAAGSVDMAWQDAAAMLRSPDFFDVAHYPEVRFRSTAVEPLTPGRYRVRGLLEIRGITQPLVLDARLVGRHVDRERKAEIADFVVSGELRRSAFGMTADAIFISDIVRLTINARIQLDTRSGGG